jgi:hypothetical protein
MYALVVPAFPVPALAQWTVINLHPAGATESYANAVGGGQQVGNALFGGVYHACMWTGSAESCTDLNPDDLTIESYVYGVDGGQQAGFIYVAGLPHACRWSGTAASRMDINPAVADASHVWGLSAGRPAGSAFVAGMIRAGMWNPANVWTSLHPAGATESWAFGVGGGQQVGRAVMGTPLLTRAIVWTGSATLWQDLNPVGSTYSEAVGASGGQQVGTAIVGASHASLWTGNANSWVDLNPAGSEQSSAFATDGIHQVGQTYGGGLQSAGVWKDTAASWVSLHAFLPPEFNSSTATGVSHDAEHHYVVGSGYNGSTSRTEALLWVMARPPCSGDVTGDGESNLADLAILLAHFGMSGATHADGDLDGNGIVDLNDLTLSLSAFGIPCP